MAFNNSVLRASANEQTIAADGDADLIFGTVGQADLFIFAPGTTGDDTIVGFNRNDSLVSDKMIFDGNKDGIITLGNEVLDLDRTSAKNAGADQISLLRDVGEGEVQSKITDLRYLGTKETGTAQYVYADADVRFALEANNGAQVVKEGLVSSDKLSAANGNFDFLYDTALGLNLGKDTITGFGAGDRLVTTIALYDGNNDKLITFGTNGILDLAGEDFSGRNQGPAGQIAFDSATTLKIGEVLHINGVDYHTYDFVV